MGEEHVRWRYSTATGSHGNSVPQPTSADSLGLFVSTTDLGMGLFDTQTLGDEVPDHRCVFAVNLNGSLSLYDASVYMTGSLPEMSTLQIGADPAGVSVLDSASAQAGQIFMETEEPPGVTFRVSTTPQTAIPLGKMGPGTAHAVWVRRKQETGATAAVRESFTLRLSGTLAP